MVAIHWSQRRNQNALKTPVLGYRYRFHKFALLTPTYVCDASKEIHPVHLRQQTQEGKGARRLGEKRNTPPCRS